MVARFIERLVLPGALVLAAPAASLDTAQAQGLYGYAFAAPGAVQCCGEGESTLHVGGGGEFVTSVGAGIGAEIGFLGPTDAFSVGIGVFSLNGSYHFGRSSQKLRPFITGGYSLFFREGTLSLWNVGGGVQYWFRPGFALRVEVRDHIDTRHGDSAHFWGVRGGVSFGHGRS